MCEQHVPASAPQAPWRTIVLIEPSLALRAVLTTALRKQGLTVICFASPVPALSALRSQQIAWPALVLLAECLPRSTFGKPRARTSPDGWEVLRLFGQWQLPLRTILLLDEAGLLPPIEARLAGACTTLAKPFRLQHLIPLVQLHARP